eukprot:scaffold28947_cov109-Isochrysis_galbana.AAC.3
MGRRLSFFTRVGFGPQALTIRLLFLVRGAGRRLNVYSCGIRALCTHNSPPVPSQRGGPSRLIYAARPDKAGQQVPPPGCASCSKLEIQPRAQGHKPQRNWLLGWLVVE